MISRTRRRQRRKGIVTKRWKFFGTCIGGAPFDIEGVNVWAHDWVSRKNHPRIDVRDPGDGAIIDVGVYSIVAGAKKVRFAAGAFSDSVVGFYVPQTRDA